MKLSTAQIKALRCLAEHASQYPMAPGCEEGVDVHAASADALVTRGLAARTSRKITRTTRHRDRLGSDLYWRTRDVTVRFVKITDAGRAALAATQGF